MVLDNEKMVRQWKRTPAPAGTWVVILLNLLGGLFAIFFLYFG